MVKMPALVFLLDRIPANYPKHIEIQKTLTVLLNYQNYQNWYYW